MPVTLPPSVRQALGDSASDDFEQWFRDALEERTVTRDEHRNVLSRLDVIENDVRHLQGTLDGFREEVNEQFRRVDDRFNQIDERFTQIDDRFTQIDERFKQIDERFKQIDERFKQIDERFKQIDDRFKQIDERFQSLETRLDRFYDRTVQIMVRWTVGTIALFGTLITALIAIAEFF